MIKRSSLRTIREKNKITQRELAEKLDITEAQYRNIETGRTNPSFGVAVRVAKVLDSPIETLFDVDFLASV